LDEELLQIARVEVGERLDRIEATLLELDIGTVATPEVIDELFRDAHTIKGTAAMLHWELLSQLSDVMEERLAAAHRSGELAESLIDPSLQAVDAMRRALVGEAVDAAPVLAQFARPGEAGSARASGPDGGALPAGGSIRIPAHKVDRMLDAVGEAMLHHRRLEHQLSRSGPANGDQALEEELSVGARLLGELQDAVLAMRTLPLHSIAAPLSRAVRDAAAQEGKLVELRLEGTDTQLDRVILEGIGGSITHLLRNAVAHGIESPQERGRLGKDPIGQIVLRASQRQRQVTVEVSDDGRGVAPELLAQGQATGSLAAVLAQAGLSTAQEVSQLAGRGVGLDAVRAYVEGLGGQLEATSRPGSGTSFTMVLPLTLALVEVLLCERGGQPFGIPLGSVREVAAVPDPGAGVLELRGEAVPVADLAELIGASAPRLDRPASALVLAGGPRRLAVACDRLLGEETVVLKALGELLATARAYLGAAILGDGRVALILDPGHLLGQRAQRDDRAQLPGHQPRISRQEALVSRPEAPVSTEPARVLVVDDQAAARRLERNMLEAAGHVVETAAHGRDALARLDRPPPVSLLVTDIQMPEMDGWELLDQLRRSPHASLPVLVVSSGEAPADRARALELGAAGYLLKQELDPQAFREAVGRLLGASGS